MSVTTLNYYYRVQMTVARFTEGVRVTTTYEFTSKELKDSTSISTYWPILQSVGELTLAAGETLPTATVSAVVFDNRRGQFGANRRLSDLFERYSPIDQDVTVYVAEVANNVDTVSSWETLGKAKVLNWQCTRDHTLSLNLSPLRFDEKILTLEVARTVSGMESAPESSLGRPVPLLIGTDLSVVPVRVSADGATTAKFAVGTCLYQHLNNKTSAAQVYTRDFNGDWEVVQNEAYDETATTTDGSISLESNSNAAIAISMGANGPGGGSLAVGVQFIATPGGSGASNCLLRAFILRVDTETYEVVEEVAAGTAALNQYDGENVGAVEFPVNVAFDTPGFLRASDGRYGYALGISATGWAVGDLELAYVGIGAIRAFVRLQDGGSTTADSADGWVTYTTIAAWKAKILTPTFTFTNHVSAYTQSGLTYTSLTLTQPAPDSGQSSPNFDNTPILVGGMIGLSDYLTPFTNRYKPQELLHRLSYLWYDNAWSDPATWDTSTLDSSHYAYLYEGASYTHRSRGVSGVVDQKATFSQVASEVARGTASKVGMLSNGKAFLYPWGIRVTPAADIPACDVIFLSWEQRDVSTVVNRAVVSVNRSPLYAPKDFQPGSLDVAGYVYTTDFSAANYTQVEGVTTASMKTYGTKDLASGQFPLWPYSALTGGQHMGGPGSILAEFYFARFGKPLVYTSFIVPWHRYKALKMFDVITATSTDFPAFLGTDPEPELAVVDTGSTVTQVHPNAGHEYVRAQTYRMLVEGVSSVLAMEHAPAVRLTCLVLLNDPFDPT